MRPAAGAPSQARSVDEAAAAMGTINNPNFSNCKYTMLARL